MAGTKIKHSYDCRKSPNKKHKYPVEHMEVPAEEANENSSVYFDHKTREQTWMTEQKIERLGVELLQWVETPLATKLSKFFHARRITNQMVLEWCKKWPTFAADYQLAKEIIGGNLWDGALHVDSGIREGAALRFLPVYDNEYKEETIRITKLRIEEKNAEQNKVVKVLIERYLPEPTETKTT